MTMYNAVYNAVYKTKSLKVPAISLQGDSENETIEIIEFLDHHNIEHSLYLSTGQVPSYFYMVDITDDKVEVTYGDYIVVLPDGPIVVNSILFEALFIEI